MFGWRRKRDGFEWRSYVRTTILLKRQKRREQLDEAKQAALDGLAEAGRAGKAAGQSGMEAARRGFDAARREAQAAGAKFGEKVAAGAREGVHRLGQGAQVAGRAARAGALSAGNGLWRFSRASGGRIRKATGLAIDRLAEGLSGIGGSMSPRVSLPLVIAGAAAAIGAAARYAQHGFDGITLSAGVIAAGLLGTAALPVIAGRASLSAPFTTRRYNPESTLDSALTGANTGFANAARAFAFLLVVGAIGGVVWLVLPLIGNTDFNLRLPQVTAPIETIEGQAKALTGDVMTIGKERVVLKGIEAPEVRQTCQDEGGRDWRCGRSALNALRRITGYENVVCTVSETDAAGRKVSDCRIGDTNIAAELVKEGHVFAQTGLFRSYGDEEDAAKAARRGIWQGEAQRPMEFRAERWELAKLKAPDGCPIKGKGWAKRREKVYLLPWSSSYDSYGVSRSRGDRWFCSEREALAAGWSPFES